MTEVAPRIHRLGRELVNSYLVEDSGEVTIVDAGAPAYWRALPAALAGMGRSFDDVRAVLLTHGHDDHRGFAERARRGGVPVQVHELDAALARGEQGFDARIKGPYRPRPILGFLWFLVRSGLVRVPKVQAVSTFGDGVTLDVPGAPRVIHVPGHTPGSAALHFAGHDALFAGDAINTYSVTSGRSGPQLSPFNKDRGTAFESLARLETVTAGLVLPGHGAPWRDGVQAALAAIRAGEVGKAG